MKNPIKIKPLSSIRNVSNLTNKNCLAAKWANNNTLKSTKKLPMEENNWKLILGRKGPLHNAHKLANAQINSYKPITFTVINKILAYCNITITEDILNILINSPSIILKNLDKIE